MGMDITDENVVYLENLPFISEILDKTNYDTVILDLSNFFNENFINILRTQFENRAEFRIIIPQNFLNLLERRKESRIIEALIHYQKEFIKELGDNEKSLNGKVKNREIMENNIEKLFNILDKEPHLLRILQNNLRLRRRRINLSIKAYFQDVLLLSFPRLHKDLLDYIQDELIFSTNFQIPIFAVENSPLKIKKLFQKLKFLILEIKEGIQEFIDKIRDIDFREKIRAAYNKVNDFLKKKHNKLRTILYGTKIIAILITLFTISPPAGLIISCIALFADP